MAKPYLYHETHEFLKGKSEDRIEYLRLLVEDELLASRDDFTLCKNEKEQVFYYHKDLVLEESPYLLNASEIEEFDKKLYSYKMDGGGISPQEFTLKKNIRTVVESYIPERRKEKRNEEKSIDWKKISFILLGLFSIISTVWYLAKPSSAQIRIITNDSYKRVLVNDKVIHISNSTISNLDTGLYRIRILFNSNDSIEKKIHVKAFKTYQISFFKSFDEPKTDVFTGLKIESNMDDYFVIVDSVHYKSSDFIHVEPGSHIVKVFKKGYRVEPAFRSIFLTRGEKSTIPFTFEKLKKVKEKGSSSLSISTNILDAIIYINGSKSPNKGNTILRNLDPGTYNVQVFKKGYTSTPKERVIYVTRKENRYNVDFKLEKTSGNVSITTLNQQGDIFLNGSKVGVGQISQMLGSGKHEIVFSDKEGYITPEPKSFELKASESFEYVVKYYPKIDIRGEFKHNGFISNHFSITYGYVKDFRFNKNVDRKVSITENGLQLDYPFEYNNPPAGHAIVLNFTLPNTFETIQTIHLKLDFEVGKETYSISRQPQPELSIVINNKRKLMKIRPTENFITRQINTFLKQGENEILLYLTENNNVPIILKSTLIYD